MDPDASHVGVEFGFQMTCRTTGGHTRDLVSRKFVDSTCFEHQYNDTHPLRQMADELIQVDVSSE